MPDPTSRIVTAAQLTHGIVLHIHRRPTAPDITVHGLSFLVDEFYPDGSARVHIQPRESLLLQLSGIADDALTAARLATAR